MGLKETLQKWFGTAKETAADLSEKAQPHVDRAVKATKDAAEKAQPHIDKGMQKAKETATDLSEKAQPYIEKAKDKAKEVAAEAASDAAGKAKHTASDAADKTADKVADAAESAADKVADAAESAAEKVADAGDDRRLTLARVSQRLGRLPGSATLAINNRAREMVAAGRDVISFGAGEPDFPTPENIVTAAVEASGDPANHHYTANVGLRPLRSAIADYTRAHSGVYPDEGQILVTNGAKQAIFQTFAALLDPGDEALLPAPHWVTYPSGIELAGGVAVSVPTALDDGFKVTVDDLERHLTPRTKMLVFVSPSNPTGAVYTAGEVRAIGEWARDNGIWVMADEIYQRLVYGRDDVAPSIAAATAGLENVVLINGVAKSFAMTGWRVGWMIGPADVIGAAARHQSHATGNVNNVAQAAALEAITGPQDTVVAMREAFDKRRQTMVSMLAKGTGVVCAEPQGAFYVFPSVEGLLNDTYPSSESLAEGLLEQAGVAVVPGESFGAPGFIRLSYALSDVDLERGVSRMLDMFGRL